jgi:ABC-2 type transport system ATP-binding protein
VAENLKELLRVKGLCKRFGDLQAVKELDMVVNQGEIVGLVGPNGAGKTTAMECMLTVQNADSGEVEIEGYDIFERPEMAKANIAYVTEIPVLLSILTVSEQIQYTAEIFSAPDWRRKAESMLKGFDLEDKRDNYTWTLSKGQKQKVAVISAFAHSPKIVFFDEPLLGIDPKGARFLKDLLKDHVRNRGSVLISSHTLSLIEELCHRIYIMNKGCILAHGTLAELKSTAMDPAGNLESAFLKITRG